MDVAWHRIGKQWKSIGNQGKLRLMSRAFSLPCPCCTSSDTYYSALGENWMCNSCGIEFDRWDVMGWELTALGLAEELGVNKEEL